MNQTIKGFKKVNTANGVSFENNKRGIYVVSEPVNGGWNIFQGFKKIHSNVANLDAVKIILAGM